MHVAANKTKQRRFLKLRTTLFTNMLSFEVKTNLRNKNNMEAVVTTLKKPMNISITEHFFVVNGTIFLVQ